MQYGYYGSLIEMNLRMIYTIVIQYQLDLNETIAKKI